MKLLFLGGTVFLGRHIVQVALARGHQITLFNRGQRNPDLFPDVEKFRGDRNGDLAALQGRRWDAAIDTSGYVPRVVGASAKLLADAVDRYTFISSISVYSDFSKPGVDESTPVGTIADETVEEITFTTYGPLKALSEQAAQQAMPGRVLVIRPGYIVGPHDPTDRFTYWPHRVAQGGEMLAPGRPDQPVQFIDVRDLAGWIVRMMEERQIGIYNATGPDYALTMQRFLGECKAVTDSNVRFVWVKEEFLEEQGIEPPIWVPEQEIGAATVNCSKAIGAGLTFRPLADTIRDTYTWDVSRSSSGELRAGIRPEQEKQALRAWHNRVK
jgi:2'-hydroxyisoflavone reductase